MGGIIMRKIVSLIALAIAFGWSCVREHEGLNKTASWAVPGSDGIVEFYYLKGTMPETDLMMKVKEKADELLKSHSRVQVFVFYDKSFAKKMNSQKVMKNFFEKGIGPGIMLLTDPEQKVQGGAMMILSKESQEPEWYYYPAQ